MNWGHLFVHFPPVSNPWSLSCDVQCHENFFFFLLFIYLIQVVSCGRVDPILITPIELVAEVSVSKFSMLSPVRDHLNVVSFSLLDIGVLLLVV